MRAKKYGGTHQLSMRRRVRLVGGALFESSSSAALALGESQSDVVRCCRGEVRETRGGLRFEWARSCAAAGGRDGNDRGLHR